ncbi:MAG: lipid IV(A) palmitoyltransferase PagP [Desulfobulbus sp.]|nr:lipid IV(A) palmitoyltransferase PagP [Desulfobulbus sp.]
MKYTFLLLFLISMIVYPCALFADTMTSFLPDKSAVSAFDTEKNADDKPGRLGRLKNRMVQTWEEGNLNIFLPVSIWHNRFMYDSEKIQQYNEDPRGLGIGLSIRDEDGDSHILYAMGFRDSHGMFEPFAGYGFIKNWYMDNNKDFHIGIGYTLGITARHQYNYIPFPLPLPLFSIGYKQLAVEAAYIPGGYNDGNVLFTWLRWKF